MSQPAYGSRWGILKIHWTVRLDLEVGAPMWHPDLVPHRRSSHTSYLQGRAEPRFYKVHTPQSHFPPESSA